MPYYSKESDQPTSALNHGDERRYSVVYAIEQFMMNFNKRQDYMRVMYPTWEAHLEKVKDKVIMNASQRLSASSEDYAKLSHFLEHVEDIIREQGGTGLTMKNYEYCEDCQVNEGIRRTTFSYTVIETQKAVTQTRVTRCTCKGSCDKYPNMMPWNTLQDKIQNDARIQLHGHWVTDYRNSTMPKSITDPEGYAKKQMQIRIDEENGNPNPFLEKVRRWDERMELKNRMKQLEENIHDEMPW